MHSEFILDFGEDGSVIVLGTSDNIDEDGIVPAGVREDIREVPKIVVKNAKEVLMNPLRLLGRLFVSSLPCFDDQNFQMDEFTIEFNMGLSTETGVDNPLVTAKVMPDGSFKCTYKWSRKEESHS